MDEDRGTVKTWWLDSSPVLFLFHFFSFGGAVPEPPRGGFRLFVEEEALFPLPPSGLHPSWRSLITRFSPRSPYLCGFSFRAICIVSFDNKELQPITVGLTNYRTQSAFHFF